MKDLKDKATNIAGIMILAAGIVGTIVAKGVVLPEIVITIAEVVGATGIGIMSYFTGKNADGTKKGLGQLKGQKANKTFLILALMSMSFYAPAQIKIELRDTIATSLGDSKTDVVMKMTQVRIYVQDSTYRVRVNFAPEFDSIPFTIYTTQVPDRISFTSEIYPTPAVIRREYRKSLREKGREPMEE